MNLHPVNTKVAILVALDEYRAGLTTAEVSRVTARIDMTVHRALKRLEGAKYVRRDDGLWFITDTGRAVADRALKKLASFLRGDA